MKKVFIINIVVFILLVACFYFGSNAMTGSHLLGLLKGLSYSCMEGFIAESAPFTCEQAMAAYNPNYSNILNNETERSSFIAIAIVGLMALLLFINTILTANVMRNSNK